MERICVFREVICALRMDLSVRFGRRERRRGWMVWGGGLCVGWDMEHKYLQDLIVKGSDL